MHDRCYLSILILTLPLSAGCATHAPYSPQAFPKKEVRPHPALAATDTRTSNLRDPYDSDSDGIVKTALSLSGTPYVDGGSTTEGFDCSGFTRYIFLQHGIELPRLANDQFELGTLVKAPDLKAGDLVFFRTTSSTPSHVGVALDRYTFVHAPSQGGSVRVEQLNKWYWAYRWIGAKRIIGEAENQH